MIIALLVAINIPENPHPKKSTSKSLGTKQSSVESGKITLMGLGVGGLSCGEVELWHNCSRKSSSKEIHIQIFRL